MTKKRVLIIDDEEDYRALIKDRFDFEGFETFEAVDGAVGLQMMVENKPDIVLLDIMMPQLDGFEVMERIRNDDALSRIPIIFVTAYGRLLSEEQQRIVGDAPFLRKPFDMVELLSVMRELAP